ncbi:MAG: peptidyl-prolyl cis-trans isomerase [Microscillaceae bacterium]|nr:peptidyl-prolyl cis-trans isomerase [Microscillaceae bacterium]MDW8460496.1 peptidyl-prolyl cis-trans isomerase [Cytophagales bacterium]
MKCKYSIFIVYSLLFFFTITSCQWWNSKNNDKGSLVAKVYDKELYEGDLQGIAPRGSSSKDSALLVEKYVENWIRKQLLIYEAQAQAVIDEAELNRKLEEYKFALITHEFEKQYVSKNLDTLIPEAEIKQFYDSSKANFELKSNIIKGILVKLPADSPDKDKFFTLVQNYTPTQLKEIQTTASKIGAEVYLSDTIWVNFDEFVQGTPFNKIPNKTDFLRNNIRSEATENDYSYLLIIKSYKIANDIAPLPFVRERIKLMILNKRKTKLVKELEKNILRKAEKDKKVIIHKKKYDKSNS